TTVSAMGLSDTVPPQDSRDERAPRDRGASRTWPPFAGLRDFAERAVPAIDPVVAGGRRQSPAHPDATFTHRRKVVRVRDVWIRAWIVHRVPVDDPESG